MILTPSVRRDLLQKAHPVWVPMTISQSLDHVALSFPERPLVLTDEQQISYREMQTWSKDIAAGMIAAGVKAGEHIAIVIGNYPEFIAIKFAIARIGAVAVPINYLLRHNEMKYVLEQSDSRFLFIMDCMRERNYLSDLDQIMPGWETQGGGTYLPMLRQVVLLSISGTKRTPASYLPDLIARGNDETRNELVAREANGNPDGCSDIVYTSGTTGKSKGVMLTHQMILRAAYASAYTRAFEDGRHILFALPMYHVFGYVECLMACLFVGGAIIPHAIFDPQHMIVAAEELGATELVCVPTMTLKLLDVARQRGFAHEKLIAVFNSGGDSPPGIWQDIRNILGAREVLTAYGMSETTASTTCTLPEAEDRFLLTTNGKLKQAGIAGDPALGGFLAIYKTIDSQNGADLPLGSAGELMVRGPIVTKGYYNKPEETRAAFNADGWMHTGDVGVLDADGYLTLTGRIKETYRCGGEMVMPQEIEAILIKHPSITMASVVGISDPKMGEIGCAFVVCEGTERPDPKELFEFCSENLARFKVPRHFIFVSAEELPRTATGKIQKFHLRDLAKKHISESGTLS